MYEFIILVKSNKKIYFFKNGEYNFRWLLIKEKENFLISIRKNKLYL